MGAAKPDGMTTKTPIATPVLVPPINTTTTMPRKVESAGKKVENSTDATQGEPLAVRANKRKAELVALLEKTPPSEAALRSDIERALSAIATLMTGDVEHLSDATGREINNWLEGSKYLALGQHKPRD